MAQYIEVHTDLIDHPKTKRLKRTLGIPAVYAQGHLVQFWAWAMDYAQNGDLSRYDTTDIAEGAAWEGDADEFVAALESCGIGGGVGFLERTADGKLIIHDWHQYGGKIVITRFKDSFRKQHGRAPEDREIREAGLFPPEMWRNDCYKSTLPNPQPPIPADSRGIRRIPADSDVDKKREEKSRREDTPKPPFEVPQPAKSTGFVADATDSLDLDSSEDLDSLEGMDPEALAIPPPGPSAPPGGWDDRPTRSAKADPDAAGRAILSAFRAARHPTAPEKIPEAEWKAHKSNAKLLAADGVTPAEVDKRTRTMMRRWESLSQCTFPSLVKNWTALSEPDERPLVPRQERAGDYSRQPSGAGINGANKLWRPPA